MAVAVFVVMAWFLGGVLLNGVVFQVLWGWFVAPLFGLPLLSLPGALGLGLLANHATNNVGGALDEDSSRVCVMFLAKPVMGLLIGWIIHLFM